MKYVGIEYCIIFAWEYFFWNTRTKYNAWKFYVFCRGRPPPIPKAVCVVLVQLGLGQDAAKPLFSLAGKVWVCSSASLVVAGPVQCSWGCITGEYIPKLRYLCCFFQSQNQTTDWVEEKIRTHGLIPSLLCSKEWALFLHKSFFLRAYGPNQPSLICLVASVGLVLYLSVTWVPSSVEVCELAFWSFVFWDRSASYLWMFQISLLI